LTLTSGVPVTTADVTGAGTLYLTPFRNKYISLVTAGVWTSYLSAEFSLVLSGLTSGRVYDVFAYAVAGVPTLILGPDWQVGGVSNLARGTGAGSTELDLQDGILVNKFAITSGPGAKEGVLIGSILTTGVATTEESVLKCFTDDILYRVPRPLRATDTTDSWTYGTDTIRQANGNTANKVEWVDSLGTRLVDLTVNATAYVGANSARAAKIGIGIGSSVAFSGLVPGAYSFSSGLGGGTVAGYFAMTASYRDFVGLGQRSGLWLEKGADGTCIFLGDNGGDSQQCGIVGTLR
jgi:hypothetical protein